MHGGKGGAATTLHPKNEVAAAEAWGGLTASFHETTKQAPLLISSVPENLFPALKLAGRQAPPLLHITPSSHIPPLLLVHLLQRIRQVLVQ